MRNQGLLVSEHEIQSGLSLVVRYGSFPKDAGLSGVFRMLLRWLLKLCVNLDVWDFLLIWCVLFLSEKGDFVFVFVFGEGRLGCWMLSGSYISKGCRYTHSCRHFVILLNTDQRSQLKLNWLWLRLKILQYLFFFFKLRDWKFSRHLVHFSVLIELRRGRTIRRLSARGTSVRVVLIRQQEAIYCSDTGDRCSVSLAHHKTSLITLAHLSVATSLVLFLHDQHMVRLHSFMIKLVDLINALIIKCVVHTRYLVINSSEVQLIYERNRFVLSGAVSRLADRSWLLSWGLSTTDIERDWKNLLTRRGLCLPLWELLHHIFGWRSRISIISAAVSRVLLKRLIRFQFLLSHLVSARASFKVFHGHTALLVNRCFDHLFWRFFSFKIWAARFEL